MSRIASRQVGILSLLLGMGCLNAHAYIPPSQYMVDRWVKLHTGVQRVRFKATIIALSNGKPTENILKETTQYNLETGAMVSWVTDRNDQRLFYIENKPEEVSVITQLTFGSTHKQIQQSLKAISIPIKTQDDLSTAKTESEKARSESLSLKRIEDKIAWVIGTEDQLWFEKDRFLPLRLIFSTKSEKHGSGQYDVKWDRIRMMGEYPYPSLVRISKKDESPFLESEITEITLNPEPMKLESMRHFSPGLTPAGKIASDDLKALIRTYYELIR